MLLAKRKLCQFHYLQLIIHSSPVIVVIVRMAFGQPEEALLFSAQDLPDFIFFQLPLAILLDSTIQTVMITVYFLRRFQWC